MEREKSIPQEKNHNSESKFMRQYRRITYGLLLTLALGIAATGTAVEVKRAIEGDLGKYVPNQSAMFREDNPAPGHVQDLAAGSMIAGGLAGAAALELQSRTIFKALKKEHSKDRTKS